MLKVKSPRIVSGALFDAEKLVLTYSMTANPRPVAACFNFINN